MGKCFNCNKKDANIKFQCYTWKGLGKENVEFMCCSDECKKELEEFLEYVNKNAVKFIVITLVGVFSFIPFLILSVLTKNKNGIFMALGILLTLVIPGVTMIKYPFATPETNSWLGRKKAVKLTKIIGIASIILGIILAVLIILTS